MPWISVGSNTLTSYVPLVHLFHFSNIFTFELTAQTIASHSYPLCSLIISLLHWHFCFAPLAETWHFQEENWFSWQCDRSEARRNWCTQGKWLLCDSFLHLLTSYHGANMSFIFSWLPTAMCVFYIAVICFCINAWSRLWDRTMIAIKSYLLRGVG